MVRQYTIKEKDTLRSIAASQYGNPNRWVQIAIENNLDYPYIASAEEHYVNAKVLYPGDTIMLTFSHSDSEKVYYTEHRTIEVDYMELLMGVDIGLQNGQLVLVGGSDGIDFFQVKGASNIKQAIEHKLKVKKGTLAYYPNYGTLLRTYLGKVADLPTLELIKAEFSRTVLEDGRIESLAKVDAEFDGYDQIKIDAGLQLIGSFTAAINVRVNPVNLQVF